MSMASPAHREFLLIPAASVPAARQRLLRPADACSTSRTTYSAVDWKALICYGTRTMPTASSLAPGSLPHPRTSLIGRETACASVRTSLLDAVPLLTLTGPGGVGKTRLAQAIAHDVGEAFADGVIWVDLAPVAEPAAVAMAVATALDLPVEAETALPERLRHALHARQLLLLLDNCEHLLNAVADIVHLLLTTCPAVQVLATSRAALQLCSEHRVPVEPLASPVAQATFPAMAESDAVRLFVERAQAVMPAFHLTPGNAPSIAAICRQVDGLPLAIELAAARVVILPPESLLTQMTDRLQVLRGRHRDRPTRQQTMAATITWSYDLLDRAAQAVFRRLAVFVGGFTLDAVVAVAPPGNDPDAVVACLEDLVHHSLVTRLPGEGEPRFVMLETIRAFGLEQLATAGELRAALDAHAGYFTVLTELPPQGDASAPAPGPTVLQRSQRERANVRAAIAHLMESQQADRALRLIGNTAWYVQVHFEEGRQWLEWALANTAPTATVDRGVALGELAAMYWAQGAYEPAQRIADECLDLARRLGDPYVLATALDILGLIAFRGSQDAARARGYMTEALAYWRLIGERWRESNALHNLALHEHALGNTDAAAQRADEALALLHDIGEPSGVALGYSMRGQMARDRGDDPAALAAFTDALALCEQCGDRWYLVGVLAGLAEVGSRLGHEQDAALLLGVIDGIARATGAKRQPIAGMHYERATAAAAGHLGERAFEALREAGASLNLDAAFTLARGITIPQRGGAVRGRDQLSSQVLLSLTSQSPAAMPPLTAREQQVLALLGLRRTDHEIANHLFISRKTASSHVASILAKLGAPNRREAAAIAVRAGLL